MTTTTINISFASKILLCPYEVNFLLNFQFLAATNLNFYPILLPFKECHLCGLVHYIPFRVCHLSFDIEYF